MTVFFLNKLLLLHLPIPFKHERNRKLFNHILVQVSFETGEKLFPLTRHPTSKFSLLLSSSLPVVWMTFYHPPECDRSTKSSSFVTTTVHDVDVGRKFSKLTNLSKVEGGKNLQRKNDKLVFSSLLLGGGRGFSLSCGAFCHPVRFLFLHFPSWLVAGRTSRGSIVFGKQKIKEKALWNWVILVAAQA